ncbi:hypothetical protein V1506DRAFT_503177 [Lipomyces tetrasporus]
MSWLVHLYLFETASAHPAAIVQDNRAEMPRQVQFVKHDTPRRQIQTASRTSEGKTYAPDGTPLSGVPPKDNQPSVGWKQWVLGHDHRDGISGLSNSVTEDREVLVLESLSKHKLKTPRIRRAVNETFSASTGSSITSSSSISDSAFTSIHSSETMVISASSSDSSSTVPSSIMDETSSSSSSGDLHSTASSSTSNSDSFTPSSTISTEGSPTSSSAMTVSASSSVSSETPVSTSVWTSTLQGPGGSALSTVTQTTVIYNIHSQTPSESPSSAVGAAPQLQTTADVSEATHRSVGPSAAIAAVLLMGILWLL